MLYENNIIYLVLKVLITVTGTIGMMTSTTDFRLIKKKSTCILILSVYALYVIVSTHAIIHFLGYEYFLRVFLITISCPAVFLMHNISNEPFQRLVFTRATHILVSMYIAATVTLSNTALHGTELSDLLLRLLIYPLVILFDFQFVRPIYMDIISSIKKGWGILSLIPCALIILAVTTAFYPVHYTQRTASVVLIYMLGIIIVILYAAIGGYLFMQYDRISAEQNREILECQINNIRKESAAIEALTEQARIVRHDTRHILSTIVSLAESKDMQAILDFIKNTGNIPTIPKFPQYCKDPILNATLSSCFQSAEKSGITLETSISIPDLLPVDSAQLAICFANALENAIKYCENLPEKERKIIFTCTCQPNLMFQVINPYNGNVTFSKKQSLKLPENNLNINLYSIVTFCEKYNAFSSFTAENGWFKVTVTL